MNRVFNGDRQAYLEIRDENVAFELNFKRRCVIT